MTHSALESQYNAAGSLPSKKAPGSAPVKLSGRLFEPDRVVVSDSPHHKDGRECVNDESRVEVLQIAGADDDRRAKKRCHRCRKRRCTTRRETSRGISASSSRRCGRKTLALSFHSAPATAASRTNPGQMTPNRSRKKPSRSGGKKPPSPPIAPTSPVTTPVLFGKYCGTSLKTPPFPMPSSTAQPSAPTVNGTIDADDISSANGTIPANTPHSTRAPPMRSESHPPAGLIVAASTTNPAVRKPASPSVRRN